MSRIGHVAFALLLVLDLAAFGAGALAQTPPQGVTPTGSPIPYSRALIPLPGTSIRMQARIFRPPGAGPFRLAVISHGTDELDIRREQHVIPEYRAMVALLLRRGYAVVVPQRPGHGETGGPYLETAGDCDFADFATAGHATARSIKATIEYMGQQPYVRRNRAVLIGHSAGAWGSLALASRYPDLVESVINFSGGRGGHSYDKANQNCSPERLVQTAGDFGRTTRVPTLWLYSSNDSYFGPALARQMADAYRAAGGAVEFRQLPPFGSEGHFVLELPEAASHWQPLVDTFLSKHQTR